MSTIISQSNGGAIDAGIYLIIVICCLLLPLVAKKAELGIFAFVLTFPWSFIFAAKLKPRKAENAIKTEAIGLLILCASALLNAAIIYFLTEWLIKKTC